jgi:hypothetical protein
LFAGATSTGSPQKCLSHNKLILYEYQSTIMIIINEVQTINVINVHTILINWWYLVGWMRIKMTIIIFKM